MTSSSGTASLRPCMLSTPRERLQEAALAQVRDIARVRGATLSMVGHQGDTGLGGADMPVRCATLPFLVLPRGVAMPPRCILVATDFSESSLCAAQAAIGLARDAEVHLVHVCPRRWCCTPCEARAGEPGRLSEPFASLFAALEAMLNAPAARFTRAILDALDGDPVDALLEHARRRCVDLIALGVHGHASVHEQALGLVTERVLREAECSVLVSGFEARIERNVSWPGARQCTA